MKTTAMHQDDNGKYVGFFIENAYIGVKKTASVLTGVDGVTDVCIRRLSNRREFGDARVKFKYQNKACEVIEPFGDNSEYWIAPAGEEDIGELNLKFIEQAFKSYKLPLITKIVGDIVSLKFITALFKKS